MKNYTDEDSGLAKKLKKYNTDRSAQSDVRDARIPDLSFARWSQTEDEMSEASTTQFVGEFNIIGRERKNIQAEFRQNEVEVKYRSKKGDNDDLDEFMQGKYRTDRRLSKSRQCFSIAQDDAIDCGFGAWRLHTVDDDSEDMLSTTQEVRRSPIPEAIRRVWFDSNSKLADKSDAKHCSLITSFTRDGYECWLGENDIEEQSTISFDSPERSIYERVYGSEMQYGLHTSVNEINILEFYEIEDEAEMYWLYLGVDENGQEKVDGLPAKEAKAMGMPEPFKKKKLTKQVCKKTVTNGIDILMESYVPGGCIPIIPMYGERNFIENGTENFYGIVKAAKDPQKLINSAYNYLTSLMMFSPVPKPIYDPRQIEGFEHLYEDANNHDLAFQYQNTYYETEKGETLNFQQQYTQPPPVPPAVGQILAGLPALTDSILNPGVTEDSFNSQMSGVALQQIKEQIGVMRFIYVDNWAEAMRHDADVYAKMLAAITDTTKVMVLTNVDGTTKDGMANEQFYDVNQMSVVVRNPIKDAKFEVYSDVGPSHTSQREAALANLKEIFATLPPGDPMQQIVMLSILAQQDGEGLDELNKVARYQMRGLGLDGIEPQTEVEAEFVARKQQEAQMQNNQPPLQDQILLMQEQTKQLQAQQAMMREQNQAQANQIKAYQAQTGAQNDQANTLLKQVDSETKRMEAMIKAEQAGADIENTNLDTVKKGVESQMMQADIAEKQLDMDIRNLPTDELIRLMSQ